MLDKEIQRAYILFTGNPAEDLGNYVITNSKQLWEVGETVKVGFMKLVVLAKIATPGDYAPDAYALTAVGGGKFYRFVPHNGLQRCDSLAASMEA